MGRIVTFQQQDSQGTADQDQDTTSVNLSQCFLPVLHSTFSNNRRRSRPVETNLILAEPLL
jgi:hypothetical protein